MLAVSGVLLVWEEHTQGKMCPYYKKWFNIKVFLEPFFSMNIVCYEPKAKCKLKLFKINFWFYRDLAESTGEGGCYFKVSTEF